MVNSSRGFNSLSRSFRKFFSLLSDTWKNILHCERIELQSCSLQKSQDNLHGKLSDKSKLLESLSTTKYSSQFSLLEQSQNLIQLLISLLKKSLSSPEIAAE